MRLPHNSFLISLTFTFLIGYAFSDLAQFVFTNLKVYDHVLKQRRLVLIHVARTSDYFLKQGELELLIENLKKSRELEQVDYFLVKRSNQVLDFGSPDNQLSSVDGNYDPEKPVINPKVTYLSINSGENQMMVGIRNRSRLEYLVELARKNSGALFFDIFIIAAMAGGLALFFFKDLGAVIHAFQKKGRGKFVNLVPDTHEAKVMLEGLRSYEGTLDRLQKERSVLRTHLNSALRSELDSGITPPYQFRCTMVRTDINSYSTIYASYPVEDFMRIINEFFSGASKIIARYNGYISDFVGDEIIFYFKELSSDGQEDSALMALAAVRDIHELAKTLHEKTTASLGHPFTVKSAVACGSLRFGHHVDGFALSGGVFVETVRILSCVEERQENSVYLPQRVAARVAAICLTGERKSVELRGITGITQLHRVVTFSSASRLLESLNPVTARLFKYFRSDSDILAALNFLKTQVMGKTVTQPVLLELMRSIQQVAVPLSHPQIKDSFVECVNSLLPKIQYKPSHDENVLISLSLSLSTRVIARESYDPKLKALFHACLSASDRRVVANAVDALIYFDPAGRDEVVEKLLKNPDNRVQANALIKAGLVDLSRPVMTGLQSMLDSPEALRVASGAYAIAELMSYYLREDPQFIQTQFSFQELVKRVSGLSQHADPRVSRQALRLIERAAAFEKRIALTRIDPKAA